MNDFANFEKNLIRELSCRLCLCTDVVKLKPLSAELKRKFKKLFNITVRSHDNLPKAICHDCLQQISAMHLYAVKVEKNQKFLNYHETKNNSLKLSHSPKIEKLRPLISPTPTTSKEQKQVIPQPNITKAELQQGDIKETKRQTKKTVSELKYLEAMPLEEFAEQESVDKSLLNIKILDKAGNQRNDKNNNYTVKPFISEIIDPIVIIDGKPAKQGAELDKQITLFYKMECCICHERGFHFRSLMTHYKERHGVPGYVTCCAKKFHYFYPKKIIEHMAYHLQPNIFMCSSCYQNFQTSHDLNEHNSNGGRSGGKIVCPRCSERYPTYHELGFHLVSHRTDTLQCDYCGKLLKHHHRKKTVNHMDDVILCSSCVRALKNIEKQEKENKEKAKDKRDTVSVQKNHKFRQAIGLTADEASTD